MSDIIGSFASIQTAPTPNFPANPPQDVALRQAAAQLETGFIAEMLKSAGFGKSRDSFGGGVGEDGFASFLVNKQAESITAAGGFGLTEQIYQSLLRSREGFDDSE